MTQVEALKILKTGASVFLTGEPGSGKTYLVNEYIEYLRSHRVEPAVTASTGIAATHLNGRTIHSWSGIGITKSLSSYNIDNIAQKSHIKKRIQKTHVLIIDEISMLDATTLSMVEAVCREVKQNDTPFGGIQTILVGDFFQLPPVAKADENVQFAFESEAWERLSPEVCYLTEQHRQEDAKFLSVLNAIRGNNFQEEHFDYIQSRMTIYEKIPEGITKLFPHNVDVDRVNNEELSKLPAKIHHFRMDSKGPSGLTETLSKGCLSPEELILKKDAVVMFTKNSPRDGFVNGTLGKILSFDEESGYPIVKTTSGKEIKTEPMDWTIEEHGLVRAKITQIPLRLAWAITVHKSQGMSLDGAVMNLKAVFEYGQGYVALSRVRSLDGLHLLGLNNHALLVHPEILEKDEGFRKQSGASSVKLDRTSSDILQTQQSDFIVSCGGNLKAEKPQVREMAKKATTQDKTLVLFKEGRSIAEIAEERGYTEGTILSHLEILISQSEISRKEVLSRVGPTLKKSLKQIHKAFRLLDTDKLFPVHEHLGGKFSYDELRIARMLMS